MMSGGAGSGDEEDELVIAAPGTVGHDGDSDGHDGLPPKNEVNYIQIQFSMSLIV